MSETELRELAGVGGSLTDSAREVLAEEISRRRLAIPVQDSSVPAADVKLRALVTVREFTGLPEAILAKSILESAGIECFLADDILIRMDWFWSNLLGGVKVRVTEEDLEVATQLLERGIPERFDVEGVGEYEQPRCPHCGSLDVSFHAMDAFGIPLSSSACYWKCQPCGHRWPEPDREAGL